MSLLPRVKKSRKPLITLLENNSVTTVKGPSDILPGVVGTQHHHQATYNVRAAGTPSASWVSEMILIVYSMVNLMSAGEKWDVHAFEATSKTMQRVLKILKHNKVIWKKKPSTNPQIIVFVGSDRKKFVRSFVLDPPPDDALPDIFGTIHSNLTSMLQGIHYLGTTTLHPLETEHTLPTTEDIATSQTAPIAPTLTLDVGGIQYGDTSDKKGIDSIDSEWYDTPEVDELSIPHKSLKDQILEGFCGLISSVVTPENMTAMGSALFS